MKRTLTLLLIFLTIISFAQRKVAGFVKLENNTDHSGISLHFENTDNANLSALTKTQADGYFEIEVLEGEYLLRVSKEAYLDSINAKFEVNDTTADLDINLLERPVFNVTGEIGGVLEKGDYYVTDTLVVTSKLSISGGTRFFMSEGAVIEDKAGIEAVGSSNEKICFTGNGTERWSGIIRSNVLERSVYFDCIFEGLKNAMYYELLCDSEPTVFIDCEIRDVVHLDTTQPLLSGLFLSISSSGLLFYRTYIHDIHASNELFNLRPEWDVLSETSTIEFSGSIIEDIEFGKSNSSLGYNDGDTAIFNASYGSVKILDSRINSDYKLFSNYTTIDPSVEIDIRSCDLVNTKGGVILEKQEGQSFEIHNSLLVGQLRTNDENGLIMTHNSFWNNGEPLCEGCTTIGVMNSTNANGDPADSYNNISWDPQITDWTKWPDALDANSALVDAGSEEETYQGGFGCCFGDLNGVIRGNDGNGDDVTGVDIGAYEFLPTTEESNCHFSLKGTLTNEGTGIEGTIYLIDPEHPDSVLTHTSSNSNGEYVIERICENSYTLMAVAPSTSTGTFIPTYYFEKRRLQEANEIDLSSNLADVNVEMLEELSTGLDAQLAALGIKIFPNPASQELSIETATNLENIVLFDLTGRNAHDLVVNELPQGLNIVDISHLSSGYYFISFEAEGDLYNYKLLIL